MALPDLIEIVPLSQPVRAEITSPGSKSVTNRALILAALADGEVTLNGALWSEDTQIMVDCLQELGFMANVERDPNEAGNRTITVYGQGGRVPSGGTESQPLELFVGNAGTAARFLSAFVCLGRGVYRLHGVPRMHERPQSALFQALRQLGCRVEAEQGNDRLPARIFGGNFEPRDSVRERKCAVSISESSQFASALFLVAKQGGWEIEVTGDNAEESPYVAMTTKMIESFPHRGGRFQIEPDASSGSYFWAASWLLSRGEVAGTAASSIIVSDWPDSGLQRDANFTALFPANRLSFPSVVSRSRDLADAIMTAIVMAPFAPASGGPIRFADLGRLRVQECERVAALRTELTRCGAKVFEEGDTLVVHPSPLHGAVIETYNDHRMAMCFAILGLKVPGIKLKNPACVKKTFPNFFQKLAAPPPLGLGATIRDANGNGVLTPEQLFAD